MINMYVVLPTEGKTEEEVNTAVEKAVVSVKKSKKITKDKMVVTMHHAGDDHSDSMEMSMLEAATYVIFTGDWKNDETCTRVRTMADDFDVEIVEL